MMRLRLLALAALPVLIFAGATTACILYDAPTYNEPTHMVAGYTYLAMRDFRLDHDVPPLTKELAALPIVLLERVPYRPRADLWAHSDQFLLGQDFLYSSGVPVDRLMLEARVPMLALGLALVLVTGWWAYRLWGAASGLTALALAAFDPNLIAHSALVNSDIAAALFSTLALYLFWEHTRSPSVRHLVLSGLACGLALSSKFSCLTVVAALGLASLGWTARGGSLWAEDGPARPWRGLALAATLGGAVTLAVIPPFYFFLGWGGYFNWFDGLSWVREHMAAGHPAFLLGQYSMKGWWLYFPIAFLVKTPLGTLAAVILSLALWKRGAGLGWREVLTLMVPPVVFFSAAVLSTVDIGLRHVLPVYPFLLILASRLITIRPFSKGFLLSVVPLAWTALSMLAITPYQLTYFNELAGGPKSGMLYLSDSNLDWGQDLKALARWVRAQKLGAIYLSYYGAVRPAEYGIRYKALPGDLTWRARDLDERPSPEIPSAKGREILAISVSNLQGLWPPRLRKNYGWLMQRQPISRLGNAIWVFDVTGDALAHLRIAEIYLSWNKKLMAARELERACELDPNLVSVKDALARLKAHPP